MKFITQDLDLWVDAHKAVPILIASLAIVWVVSLFIQHPGSAWGALVRICASLFGAFVVLVLVWQAVGGWFPPAVSFLCFTGLISGVTWGAIYVSRRSKISMPQPHPPKDHS